MVEEKSMHEQAREVQNLAAKIVAKGIPINKRQQVPSPINKCPPSQNDSKVNLKHRREALTIDDLMSSIKLKKTLEKKNKKFNASTFSEVDPNANAVQN